MAVGMSLKFGYSAQIASPVAYYMLTKNIHVSDIDN